MKKFLCFVAILGISVASLGCISSRTDANLGPLFGGIDVKTHKEMVWSFDVGPSRTVISAGVITVGVDGKIDECTEAFSLNHKTELIKEVKSADNG